jgi:hypothetical protein
MHELIDPHFRYNISFGFFLMLVGLFAGLWVASFVNWVAEKVTYRFSKNEYQMSMTTLCLIVIPFLVPGIIRVLKGNAPPFNSPELELCRQLSQLTEGNPNTQHTHEFNVSRFPPPYVCVKRSPHDFRVETYLIPQEFEAKHFSDAKTLVVVAETPEYSQQLRRNWVQTIYSYRLYFITLSTREISNGYYLTKHNSSYGGGDSYRGIVERALKERITVDNPPFQKKHSEAISQ